MAPLTTSPTPPERPPVVRDERPIEDKSATSNGDMRGINRASVESRQLSRVQRQKEYFAEQDRETIKIPMREGEQRVQVNGYVFQIQAGVKVKVPTDIAEILRDAEVI